MKKMYKIMILALGVVSISIAAVATTAMAAQKANVSGIAVQTQADYQAWGCQVVNGNNEAVASLLGMTAQEIQTQLEQGKSLVEIAAVKAVSEDQLVAVIFDPMKQYMQQQVVSGAWTQAELDSHLTIAERHVRQLVNANGTGGGYGGCGGTGGGTSVRGGGMMGGGFGGRANGFGRMMRGWY